MGDSSQFGGSSGGGIRPNDPRRPQGSDRPNPFASDRSVSYEPEVRDWSDLPRVGLPLVGLLSLVGLLWYWLSAVIGGPVDVQPTSTPLPSPTETIVADTPTPTGTPPIQTVVPTVGPELTETSTAPEPPPTLEPVGPEAGGETPPPTNTRVTTADVNMRAGPATTEPVVELLKPGTVVTVVGDPVPPLAGEVDPTLWVPVLNEATSKQGFIRQDYLQ